MKNKDLLKPSEDKLVGGWVKVGDEIRPDEVLSRIRYLVDTQLERLGTDETGWDALFLDPSDGRYWELVYPQGEMHGGGPASIVNLTKEQAMRKYPHIGQAHHSR
jgi:hypothetical protein